MSTVTSRIKSLNEEYNVSVYYSTTLSEFYFEDWKNSLGDNLLTFSHNRGGLSYVVIGDLSKPYFTKTQLHSKRKAELQELWEFYNNVWANDELTKNDLIADLLCVDLRQHYTQHYKEANYGDLEYDFCVSGYCQGDVVKVNILDGNFNWNTKDYLRNLFYDCPVDGVFTWQGEEYFLNDFLECSYTWDKQQCIDNFKKTSGIVCNNELGEALEFLEEFLPSELDYK